QLHEQLYMGSWKPALGRFRSSLAFRGQADASADLTTSLARLGGDFASNERHLLRNFRKYAGTTNLPNDSLWNWLALAKHHGLPTRLLDWSYSPYTALHFATANPEWFHLDGAIWTLDYVEVHRRLPT